MSQGVAHLLTFVLWLVFFLFFFGGVKGTGWISCVAGILLGESGINHGVEIYSCVVQFSTRKARKFAAHLSAQATPVPFTKPRFAAGNCYYLDPAAQRYDRIYVGYAKHVKLNGGKIKGGGSFACFYIALSNSCSPAHALI